MDINKDAVAQSEMAAVARHRRRHLTVQRSKQKKKPKTLAYVSKKRQELRCHGVKEFQQKDDNLRAQAVMDKQGKQAGHFVRHCVTAGHGQQLLGTNVPRAWCTELSKEGKQLVGVSHVRCVCDTTQAAEKLCGLLHNTVALAALAE